MKPRLEIAAPLLAAFVLILGMVVTFIRSPDPDISPPPEVVPLTQQLYTLESQGVWTAETRQRAGSLRYYLGNFDHAAAHWEASLLLNPQNTNLLRQLAELYITRQQWTGAIDALKRLSQLNPNEEWVHYQLVLILAATHPIEARKHLEAITGQLRSDATIEAISAILSESPPDPLRIGFALAESKLWPYAERAFEHAAMIGYNAPEALAYTGLMRQMQGKSSGEWIQQAVQLAPDNARIRYVEGLHLRSEHDDLGSLMALAYAQQLEPLNAAFNAELGTAFQRLGHLGYAEYWLRQAVTLSENNPQFVEQLNLFYAREAPLLSFFGIDPMPQIALAQNDADVKAEYGWSLHLSGKTDEALKEIEAALAIDTNNMRALYYKARLFIETGSIETAKPLLQQVINADSEFSGDARRILENFD